LGGRAAIGYDHGYDDQLFYLGLALDERYVEGFVEGCLERIGEDDPDEELLLPRPVGGRDSAGGGDRKPQGRLRGQDR
jgi:hypothetical protein